MLRSIGYSPGNPWSQFRRRKEKLRWEGFAEKEGFAIYVKLTYLFRNPQLSTLYSRVKSRTEMTIIRREHVVLINTS